MEIASLILAIVGIGLTVLFAEPIWRPIRNIMTNARRRAWSADLYRKGAIYNVRHFGFEVWSVHIAVDKFGSAKLTYAGRIVNLSDKFLETFYLPFYSDARGLSMKTLVPWAKANRKALPLTLETIDAQKSKGRFAISHVPPLAPGERRDISWGINLPKLFQPGDEYFTWDVEVPYYEMSGSLQFSQEWQLLYARWKEGYSDHRAPVEVIGRTVRWAVTLPPTGGRLHLLIGLGKSHRA